jgi:16S rRNA processing protein RimM
VSAGAPRPDPGGEPGWLVVAVVRRPHGVRGELQLSLETDRPGEVFRAGRPLELGDERGRPLGRRFTVAKARPHKDGMLVVLAELTTRDAQVEALRGHTLLIPADEAAPAAEGEVLYRDLVGCEVIVQGRSVGTVHDLLATGGAELLVVRRRGARELLIPFVAEMVRTVDVEAKRVEMELPEGLLEL